MAVVDVTFDGTRLHDSDTNTGWGNFVIGGGSPASEGANAYQVSTANQGTDAGVVGKKITSTSARQGVDYIGSSVDYTAAANRLFYCKCYVSDGFDVNTTWGVEIALGSSNTGNSHRYNVAGSGSNLSVYGTYPPQGGYIITCIDPTIDTWAESADDGGTFDQTSVIWYAMGAQFINGNSKAENVAFDAIDYGTGLSLLQGDTGTQGAYTDFYVFDQDDQNNRWGAAVGNGDSVTCRGIMSIGGSTTATEFNDTTSVVTFPDGYHSRGLFGVEVNLDHASNVINDGALLIGQGTRNGADANDTRPDYTVVGTTGTSYDFSHTLRNFRDVEYTSVCDVVGADIECHLLTQNSANIADSVIRTNALTNTAVLVAPVLGTTTDLHDCSFIQSGVGHAIEITATGTHDFQDLLFEGYGGTAGSNPTASSGAADAAIYNNSGGAVTINVNGTGNSPSVRNAASSTTTIVSGAVSVEVLAAKKDGTPIGSAVTYLKASDGTGAFPFEDSVTISRSTTTATVSHTAHGLDTGDKVALAGISDKVEDNGIQQVTVIDTNSYSFTTTDSGSTSYTGTIISTFVALSGLTNGSGILNTSRVYTVAQPVVGWTRKSTIAPFLQEGVLVGTISTTTGFSGVAVMLSDE